VSAGWSVSFTVSLSPPDWEAVVVAARARGLSPSEFAAQAVQRELRLPQAASWEEGLVSACLRAEPWGS
jgi:hypothetical protein